MAAGKKKKSSRGARDMRLGVGAVAASVAVLFLLFLSFGGQTAPAEITEPPFTSPPALQDNPYGPEDFGFDGEYLTCLAGESILGIDVSVHQGEVDWQQVRQAGVQFVMVRIGYRGYESGRILADERALENLAGAREAGLRVGAYFYSQALNAEEAREEAAFAMELLEGQTLDLPLVYDWEYVSETARTGQMDPATLTDCTVAFCEAVRAGGFTPMVYFNPHLSQTLLELEDISAYEFWLAMYDVPMTFPYRVRMWQYTQTGRVAGIETDVDINLYLP